MGKQYQYRFRAKVGKEEKLIAARTFEEAIKAVWGMFHDPKELARLGAEISIVDLQTREERRYPTAREVK
jgi:hypothetical protein